MNKSDFIIISGTNDAILRSEVDKDNNFRDIHQAVNERTVNKVNLVVPSAKRFMKYFLNVKDALEERLELFTLDKKLVPRDEVEKLWNSLSSGYKGGCLTYLSDGFVQDFGESLYHLSNFRLFNEGKKQILRPTKINVLEQCVMKDCFVDLKFNKRGFPVKKSNEQDYIQGKNILFRYPRKDSVARFDADSDWAGLDCGRYPSGSGVGLGVFGYAEGVARKN